MVEKDKGSNAYGVLHAMLQKQVVQEGHAPLVDVGGGLMGHVPRGRVGQVGPRRLRKEYRAGKEMRQELIEPMNS